MVLSIDWVGGAGGIPLITVPQSDLSFVSGTLYAHDTDAFWDELKALEDDEEGIVFADLQTRAKSNTVAGTTFAPFVTMTGLAQFQYEDTASFYTVQLTGTNNDLWSVEDNVYVPHANVTVSPTNSAGLVTSAVSGLTSEESTALLRIEDGVYGQKVLYETTDATVYAPGSGIPGYVEIYTEAATPVIIGHKPIWSDEARTKGWERTDPIMFEGALVAGVKP